MNDSLYRISLDIHSTQSQVSIPVTQFDTARGILVTLTEGGKPYKLSTGCRAVFTGTKADGHKLYNDCLILNNSVIRYDFTEQTTASVGIVDASIKVFGVNRKTLTSPRLTLVVYEDTVGDIVPSESEMNVIDRIVQNDADRESAFEEVYKAIDEAYVAMDDFFYAVYPAKPTSIDLTGLDGLGRIVETFDDGSTKITTIEFDVHRNPVKITYEDGSETVLTW